MTYEEYEKEANRLMSAIRNLEADYDEESESAENEKKLEEILKLQWEFKKLNSENPEVAHRLCRKLRDDVVVLVD